MPKCPRPRACRKLSPPGAARDPSAALLKRRELSARGWALSDLLLTVVRKPDGEGHAVLTVRMAKRDFVLDNLDGRVRPWNETAYVFVKRRSSTNTGRWVSVETGRDLLVRSVR